MNRANDETAISSSGQTCMVHLRHHTEPTFFVVLKALANLSACREDSLGLMKDHTRAPFDKLETVPRGMLFC